MTTPIKPWEAAGSNLRSEKDVSSLSIQSSSRIPDVNVKTMPAVPPPLPPRPTNVAIRRPINSATGVAPQFYRGYPTTTNYMGGYNSYGGYGNYGSYGVYNGLGGYGGSQYPGYMYPNSNDPNNRLVALAEETTRPAFDSIESVVRAFGSVSFMLESTLGALHASFRAALGVADHLSHLRNILSALSVFRLLQWITRRVKKLFGAKLPDSNLGSCWGDAMKTGEQAAGAAAPPTVSSQWPLGAFFGVVLSCSYLAWRLLSFVMGSGAVGRSPFKAEENEPWIQGKDPACYFALGSHDFLATLDQELSFRAGDRLIVAPRNRQPLDCKDWLLAAHPWSQKIGKHPKIGLVPSNHIRILDRRSIRLQGGNPLVNTQSAPVHCTHAHIPTVSPLTTYPGNTQSAPVHGLNAHIPTVSPLTTYPTSNPVLQAALSNPSFQFSQPCMHPGMNLQSDLPSIIPANKSSADLPLISSQKTHSEANENNQASVASENNTPSEGIIGKPLYSPIEGDSLEDKPPESNA